jgi:hypothetical protein
MASRHPDDPEDAPDQRRLEVRSFHKVQSMDDATACLMSTLDSGNFIALDEDNDDELEDGGD